MSIAFEMLRPESYFLLLVRKCGESFSLGNKMHANKKESASTLLRRVYSVDCKRIRKSCQDI